MASRTASLLFVLSSALFFIFTLWITAQDEPATQQVDSATCGPPLEQLYTVASARCLGKPGDLICNGGWPPDAQPDGPVKNSLATQGSLVPFDLLTMVNTPDFFPDGSQGGIAWVRVDETKMDALLLGDTKIEEVPLGEDWPRWWSVIIETAEHTQVCSAAPPNLAVLQSDIDFNQIDSMRMVVNGVSVDLRGTVVVLTRGTQTLFLTIEGEVRIIANGQTQGMVAGQQTSVNYNPGDFSRAISTPAVPEPYDRSLLGNFPVELLDRPTILPEPGFVATEGTVNMRSAPNLGADLLYSIPAGEIMTILGRNPEGDWYHVRLATGQTGWMFADLLRRSHGAIQNVYSNTPVPPQRFGELGTKAVVSAPNGVAMRSAPYVSFDVVHDLQPAVTVDLLARSPYSPWVKIDAGGIIGWVGLLSLETQSIISSLPIDYDVPPPPEPPPPTQIPGIWGGAFPNPDCFSGGC